MKIRVGYPEKDLRTYGNLVCDKSDISSQWGNAWTVA